GQITFFDNGASPQVQPQSRAIEVALDMQNMTATLLRSYEHANPLVADSQGNVQVTPEGDWMVGWGQAGYFSEMNAAGQVLFNAHLPPDWESYRAFVAPWSGRPLQPPAVAAASSPEGEADRGGGAIVYASWNGDTEVISWRVLAGASAKALKPLGTTAKRGFETATTVPGLRAGTYVAVQALDAAGAVIGSSPTVAVRPVS
ncbi:MAG TPA: arylsulfotransferase family protein, partial [Solirubrobacteraceae bacterium]|nr:arylsulfotransferase family protein [Solirubrobacteraceae bacterium]